MSSFLSNLPGYRTKPPIKLPSLPTDTGDSASTDPDATGATEAHKSPGISIVIVSYNVREYLDACIQSIYHIPQIFLVGHPMA